jgi:hypothetical protein
MARAMHAPFGKRSSGHSDVEKPDAPFEARPEPAIRPRTRPRAKTCQTGRGGAPQQGRPA